MPQATEAFITPDRPRNVAGGDRVQLPAVNACLRAMSAIWPEATFDIDTCDDGTVYGQFWSPAASTAADQLAVSIDPTSDGWWRAVPQFLNSPALAEGRSMAECLANFAAALARVPADFLLRGAAHVV